MEYVLIIGIFQSFFLAILLLAKKKKSISDYILSGHFILYALTLLLAYLEIYNRQHGYLWPWLINTSTPLILLHGPVLWCYIKSLTDQHFRFKSLYLLHSLPFITVCFLLYLSIYRLPVADKIILESTESFMHQPIFPLIVTIIGITNQVYFIWGLRLISIYRKQLKTYFSRIEAHDLKWLQFLFSLSIVFYVSISLLYALTYLFGFMSYSLLQLVGFSFAAIFILILGFYGHRQGNLFASAPIALDLKQSAQIPFNERVADAAEETFIRHLLQYMNDSKPFLNPELTLSALSSELNVSPEYLSTILNGRLNRNFFDFVNHYRIEEFKIRVRDPKNKALTLISIAFDCGFNSKATFNRVFKQVTGVTPSSFTSEVSIN